MKKERKNLILLLSVLMVLLSSTMYIALKMDMNPLLQRKNSFKVHDFTMSMNQARELVNQKEYNQAIELLQAIIRKYPAEATPRRMLGELYYQQKNYAKSESAFRELLRYHPDNAIDYHNLSETLIRQNRLAEARDAVDQSILLAPDNGMILLHAANLYAILHKDEKAVELLEKALSNGVGQNDIERERYIGLIDLQDRPVFKKYIQQKQYQ